MALEQTTIKCPHCDWYLLFSMNNYYCANDDCAYFDDCECNICKRNQTVFEDQLDIDDEN